MRDGEGFEEDLVVVRVVTSRVSLWVRGDCRVYFFFQAEDGIRDIGVTGVQTCALPISEASSGDATAARVLQWAGRDRHGGWPQTPRAPLSGARGASAWSLVPLWYADKIGRASCRERV